MSEKKSLDDIEKEFRNTLVIPDRKTHPQFFFCPVGLVGTGKTTVTKPISEKFDLIRLSTDELRKLLKENGYDYSSVKTIGLKILQEYIDAGYSISFDMDCGNPQTKSFIESSAEKSGARVFWVYINTPQEFIFEKFRKHPPSWLADNPQTMIDNYLAQKEIREKENTQFIFFYEFDTSRADIGNQIEGCSNKIEVALMNPPTKEI
jgi:predicted kinase